MRANAEKTRTDGSQPGNLERSRSRRASFSAAEAAAPGHLKERKLVTPPPTQWIAILDTAGRKPRLFCKNCQKEFVWEFFGVSNFCTHKEMPSAISTPAAAKWTDRKNEKLAKVFLQFSKGKCSKSMRKKGFSNPHRLYFLLLSKLSVKKEALLLFCLSHGKWLPDT